MFVGRALKKALIRYLENRLVEIARKSERYIVLTKNTYRNTVMKKSQIAALEEFVDNIKVLISTLGYKVLEPMIQNYSVSSTDNDRLYLSVGNTEATAMVTQKDSC